MKHLILLSLIFLSCNPGVDKNAKDKSDYFDAVSKNDVNLEAPLAGEWRYRFNEEKQTFDDYKKLQPKRARAGETKIYLLPIGNFSGAQAKVLELTRDYLEIFFQLPTKLLQPISDESIPGNARRFRSDHNVQLFTPYILDKILKGKIPGDGYSLMAISEKDLYPSDDWNFVFGIASYKDRIGVTSIFRLQGDQPDSNTNLLFLRRILSTASHEIGHMFSVHHCTFSKCVMNGSNSLEESDRQPIRLCSACQRKLHWNIQYDNRKRLTALIGYLKTNNLREDITAAEQDYNSLR